MSVDFKDVTGTPRPARDIQTALAFVESEMVKNPMRMVEGHGPAVIHYMVIRDVLRDALNQR
jgi:hypothetical protein